MWLPHCPLACPPVPESRGGSGSSSQGSEVDEDFPLHMHPGLIQRQEYQLPWTETLLGQIVSAFSVICFHPIAVPALAGAVLWIHAQWPPTVTLSLGARPLKGSGLHLPIKALISVEGLLGAEDRACLWKCSDEICISGISVPGEFTVRCGAKMMSKCSELNAVPKIQGAWGRGGRAWGPAPWWMKMGTQLKDGQELAR